MVRTKAKPTRFEEIEKKKNIRLELCTDKFQIPGKTIFAYCEETCVYYIYFVDYDAEDLRFNEKLCKGLRKIKSSGYNWQVHFSSNKIVWKHPNTERVDFWRKYFQDREAIKCPCCEKIFTIYNYHRCHIFAKENGGHVNIRPFCPSCNVRFGKNNLYKSIEKNGGNPLKLYPLIERDNWSRQQFQNEAKEWGVKATLGKSKLLKILTELEQGILPEKKMLRKNASLQEAYS
jgi:hypothetical protein